MAEHGRDYLKQEFKDGEKPSGSDFAAFIDSSLNIIDDRLTVDDDYNLVLFRGLTLNDSERTVGGTLRFNGDRVQFHNGTTWEDLVGSSMSFHPVGDAGAVAYTGGNVGIGSFDSDSPPTYRLEVKLGRNDNESNRVRFGHAVCSNGYPSYQQSACFYHDACFAESDMALRQDPNGDVTLNAPAEKLVRIAQGGGGVCLAISSDGHVIVGGEEVDLPNAGGAELQIGRAGTAYKNNGQELWDINSDARLKEDIRDLEAGLQQLMRVRPVRFRFNGKAGSPAGCEGVGIIGQEIEQIFPEMVRRVPHRHADGLDGDDLLVYNGSALTYVLVNAVKELANKVEKLEAALAEARKGQ